MTLALRAAGLCALLMFVTITMTPAANIASAWLAVPSNVGPADAIVVLGAGVSSDGVLGGASLRRAVNGMLLYQAHIAPLLVFLGTGSGDQSEASVRAALASELGLATDAILVHAGARTTREEATQVANLLRPRGIRTVLLVTDSRHMRRARYAFERYGFAVRAAPADDLPTDASDSEGRILLTRMVVQQALALFYYRVADRVS